MASYPIPPADRPDEVALVAVLEYIRECNFTSITSFLVQLFQSNDPEVRRRVGMMCSAKRDGFRTVLRTWIADPRTSQQIDDVAPEFSARARESFFQQLSSEMLALGRKGSPISLPASDFASYDWQSFNFDSLAESYMARLPTVFRLIKFLCGCGGPEGIVQERTDLDALAEPDDDDDELEALVSEDAGMTPKDVGVVPETPESRRKRKQKDRLMVATVVAGMICFGRSRRANILQTTMGFFAYSSRTPKRVIAVLNRLGITCSYETILRSLKCSAKGAQTLVKTQCQQQPFLITYDNFDVYVKVRDERLHNKNMLHHSTMGAVIYLRQQDGTPWTSRIGTEPALLGPERSENAFRPSQPIDRSPLPPILPHPIYPLPEQSWIRQHALANFTAEDVLDPLWKSSHDYWPKVGGSLICDLLWKYAGETMSKSKFPRIKAPELYKLAPTKVRASTLPAMDMNEGTLEGNAAILDFILDELSIPRSKVAREWLVAISGDQLTIARLRALQFLREHDNKEATLSWIAPIAGLLHVRMAAIRMIYDAHEGRADGRDPVSLRRFATLLGRTGIYVGGTTIDFHKTESLLGQVTDALLLSYIMTKLEISKLVELQERLGRIDWVAMVNEMVKEILPIQLVASRRLSELPERDCLFENAVLLLQHGLMYRDLSQAIKCGDTGRVAKQLEFFTVLFHGGKQYKYALEMLEWSAGMKRTWTEPMKRLWHNHCVVNLSGREDKFIATDHFNEHLVREVKNSHNPRNTSASDRFLRDIIARNVLTFSDVKNTVRRATGATDYGNRHSSVVEKIDVLRLVTDLMKRQVFILQKGRNQAGSVSDRFSISEAKDLFTTGWAKVRSGIPISELVKKHQGGYMEEDIAESPELVARGENEDEDEEL